MSYKQWIIYFGCFCFTAGLSIVNVIEFWSAITIRNESIELSTLLRSHALFVICLINIFLALRKKPIIT